MTSSVARHETTWTSDNATSASSDTFLFSNAEDEEKSASYMFQHAGVLDAFGLHAIDYRNGHELRTFTLQ